MKIVHADKLQELRALLVEAAESKASHVAVTSDEMRAVLAHLRGVDIFPRFFNTRAGELKDLKEKQAKIRKQLNGNALNTVEKDKLFDQEHAISARLLELEKTTPTELVAFNGVVVKTALGV